MGAITPRGGPLFKETIKKHQEMCDQTRLKLPKGDWTDEPDRFNWRTHGLDCMIVRNERSFHLCGYVGLPPTHKYYRKDHNDIDVSVHGGLTYGQDCGGAVCHIPQKGEPDELYWVGFDCAHYSDLSPIYLIADMNCVTAEHARYRDFKWVKIETESLAQQLAIA